MVSKYRYQWYQNIVINGIKILLSTHGIKIPLSMVLKALEKNTKER